MDSVVVRMLTWGIDDPLSSVSDDATPLSDASDEYASDEADDSCASSVRHGRRRIYRNDLKLRTVESMRAGANVAQLARDNDIVSSKVIFNWAKKEAEIRAACADKMRRKVTLGGQGRHTLFSREEEVVQWIKDLRREDYPLKTTHVVQFMHEEYAAWTTRYLDTKHEDSLFRLVRRLIKRYGFSFRTPSRSILTLDALAEEQVSFAANVGRAVASTYDASCIFNADETSVYFDESPGLIIAERGAGKSSKVKGTKQSHRATVLLTIAANGTKLKPLIIFKAMPGGTVEESFSDYPAGAYYTVQYNAWMDGEVWRDVFIEEQWDDFVHEEHHGPMAMYVDNFKSHVSDESIQAFAALGTELVPLSANTTAVLQPLDVGIMGPFKKKLRATALATELTFLCGRSTRPLRDRLLALRKTSADQKRRGIVEKVIAAWGSVTEDSVRKAWVKSGLYNYD